MSPNPTAFLNTGIEEYYQRMADLSTLKASCDMEGRDMSAAEKPAMIGSDPYAEDPDALQCWIPEGCPVRPGFEDRPPPQRSALSHPGRDDRHDNSLDCSGGDCGGSNEMFWGAKSEDDPASTRAKPSTKVEEVDKRYLPYGWRAYRPAHAIQARTSQGEMMDDNAQGVASVDVGDAGATMKGSEMPVQAAWGFALGFLLLLILLLTRRAASTRRTAKRVRFVGTDQDKAQDV